MELDRRIQQMQRSVHARLTKLDKILVICASRPQHEHGAPGGLYPLRECCKKTTKGKNVATVARERL